MYKHRRVKKQYVNSGRVIQRKPVNDPYVIVPHQVPGYRDYMTKNGITAYVPPTPDPLVKYTFGSLDNDLSSLFSELTFIDAQDIVEQLNTMNDITMYTNDTIQYTIELTFTSTSSSSLTQIIWYNQEAYNTYDYMQGFRLRITPARTGATATLRFKVCYINGLYYIFYMGLKTVSGFTTAFSDMLSQTSSGSYHSLQWTGYYTLEVKATEYTHGTLGEEVN